MHAISVQLKYLKVEMFLFSLVNFCVFVCVCVCVCVCTSYIYCIQNNFHNIILHPTESMSVVTVWLLLLSTAETALSQSELCTSEMNEWMNKFIWRRELLCVYGTW